MPTEIRHANVITEFELYENASVLISGDRIVSIEASEHRAEPDAVQIDAVGMFLIPGIIDTHNDSLETEINPRPSVDLPRSFALGNFERRAIASGVTTSFHAISFANIVSKGRTIERSSESARTAVESAGSSLINHQVLHRCDVWTPEGIEPIFESLRRCPIAAVSLNDHMPGQGQFRDLEKFKEWIRAYRGDNSYDADAEIERRMQRLEHERETVAHVYEEIRKRCYGTSTIVVSHDDDSPGKVDLMAEIGATVAEFPITFDAASQARRKNMWITVGAPNIVRGASTSNNLSARDLVYRGQADIVCGDYHTPSLILSAFLLADLGLVSLPQAVRMVTANPADAFGMTDRGRIAEGAIADLALVDISAGIPGVRATFNAGRAVFNAGLSSVPTPAAIGQE